MLKTIPLALPFLFACSIPPPPGEQPEPVPPLRESPPLPAGTYQIQSIHYDDASGAYDVFLLDPPAGTKPKYVTTHLRFQRLTDDEVASGQKAKLIVDDNAAADEAGGPVAHLPPDFQIEYTHNVVEERMGQPVVVRTEHSMWSPFLTGMLIGHMFSPMYYYPPPYRPGGTLTGVGGFGNTRSLAEQSYTRSTGAPPQSSRLAKSGFAKMPSASGLKSSGTGAGSSRLSGSKPTKPSQPAPRRSFGGGFGRRR
jgi:hypothetical protein